MKKLLPIILAVLGLGAGLGAGVFLSPAPEPVEVAEECAPGAECKEPVKDMPPPKNQVSEYDPDEVWDYVKIPKQFVIPVIKKDRVRALVVLSLSLEVPPGQTDAALSRTPKLRDGFLQVLFNHANSGGFDGAFTTGKSMSDLRSELLDVAVRLLGDSVGAVLIEEIVKQSV